MSDELHRGLEGVLVTESSLSMVDGEAGQLRYRGFPIDELAAKASFEEVLYLLWEGDLPTATELRDLKEDLARARPLDDQIVDLLRELAALEEEPMAALRTATSALSSTDPKGTSFDPENHEHAMGKGLRLTAKFPTILATFDRFRRGKEPVPPRDDLDHAANFLLMLTGEEPDEVTVDTLDTAMVLHADHGLNASTFSAMVTASTLSDIFSAVTSAIGTLAGPLHGGATANVMRMLLEVDESEQDPAAWVRSALADDKRIPGFGHRVYEVKDPRAYILSDMSAKLGEKAGDTKWYDYSVEIEETMTEETGIPPNVDFYSATTYYQLGIPTDLYTPIFAASRVGGWTAHILEQYEDNRIMRPRGRYIGPEEATFMPLDER